MAEATWIWYPGDFEVCLSTKVEMRREERGVIYPPIWKKDSFYHSIKFRKTVSIEEPEKIQIYADGTYSISIDGKTVYENSDRIHLQKGSHDIVILLVNEICVPAVFVQGNKVVSDESWEVSFYGKWVNAASDSFNNPSIPPSSFQLATTEIYPVKTIESKDNSLMVDFGKESFGYIRLHNIVGRGKLGIYYGESLEEASKIHQSYTFDSFNCEEDSMELYKVPQSRAFRYVNVVWDKGMNLGDVSALFEYLPLQYRGGFKCSNERLNQIWETSVYTLHLNTREFFLDGIKRDRWIWSGDSYQSFLMNYYIFFDEAVNRRTLIALRGKEPVDMHINTIMDYSFYWFLGLYDHYLYTGDIKFIKQNYEKMLSLMEFCLKRRNSNGMMEGLAGDWVFVDWADIDKRGEVSTEQILFCRSLQTMAQFSKLLNDEENALKFEALAEKLKKDIIDIFWDMEQGGMINTRYNGELNRFITKHPSIFAMMFGYLSESQIEAIKHNVLLNEKVPKITTPYMRFYELAALCEIGEHGYVIEQVLDYWGGMLDLGATTFWEEYKPDLQGSEHYEMYGNPFGKSLCHAWGASPIYLFGRYFLGVRPTKPGYETYEIKPQLGSLSWIEGTVPMPQGNVDIYVDVNTIKVKATSGIGLLKFISAVKPITSSGKLNEIEDGRYEIEIEPNIDYVLHRN